jgi:CheY-like chemotaxis protein
MVEDNSSNRFLIKQCLANYVKIYEAEDGISGVTLAIKEHFDLILIDINLGPGINGIETLHQIRQIPGYHSVPIVAVTAFAMHKDKERFLESGFDDYLAKPFTKEELRAFIGKLISDVNTGAKE